jgi:hypothetical protein
MLFRWMIVPPLNFSVVSVMDNTIGHSRSLIRFMYFDNIFCSSPRRDRL